MMPDDRARPRFLIVGAGAIGQVYGLHLQRGGAEVHMLVRPRNAGALEGPLTLHKLGSLGREARTFEPDAVWTDPSASCPKEPDAILLAIPYSGLKGDWFEALLEVAGDATIASLVPGPVAGPWLRERVPSERLVEGLITLLAYPGPMSHEDYAPGTAYYLPPMTPALFAGPRERTDAIVRLLKRGKMPSRRLADITGQSRLGTALLMPLVANLEICGWSFEQLRRSGRLKSVLQAAAEAYALSLEGASQSRPLALRVISPLLLSLGLRVASLVLPFNLERFLQLHFTKVGRQTRLILKDWLESARGNEAPAPALELLSSELPAMD